MRPKATARHGVHTSPNGIDSTKEPPKLNPLTGSNTGTESCIRRFLFWRQCFNALDIDVSRHFLGLLSSVNILAVAMPSRFQVIQPDLANSGDGNGLPAPDLQLFEQLPGIRGIHAQPLSQFHAFGGQYPHQFVLGLVQGVRGNGDFFGAVF